MDKDTRSAIQRATQAARRLLEEEFAAQLEGTFDIRQDGTVAAEAGRHLAEDPDALRVRARLVEAVAHHRARTGKAADAVAALLRETAFTTLNRFVALKMLEARKIVLECVSKGQESSGFKNEFLAVAEGLKVRPDAAYRLYLDCVFDEVGREVKVLFDRRDPASLLWPRRNALEQLLGILNAPELASVWDEDETIGWVYQYFNGEAERRQMRDESQAPRNSRELAVRNQFFTPRYVVEFLTDNTLGRTWIEMRRGETRLVEQCRYLVKRSSEVFLAQGETEPAEDEAVPVEQRTVYTPFRAKKDPREIKILDPACGSGHFLLYAFELLLTIYEEAWTDADLGPALWREVGWTPAVDRPSGTDLVDPDSVRFLADAQAHCFSCGWRGAIADARLALLRYTPGRVEGRPLVYCRRCAADRRDSLSLDLPFADFNLREALRHGWFAHGTATTFVDMAGTFAARPGGWWVSIFEQVQEASQPEVLARLHRVLPGLILRHNLHGVDIDPRAAQIAALALWMRAQRAWNAYGVRRAERPLVTRTNIVVAEPMPGEADLLEEFCRSLAPEVAGLVRHVFEDMQLAGEAGTLLRIEETVRQELRKRFGQGGLFAKQDAEQWADVEHQVYDALRAYSEQVPGGAGYRRRLFAEDAARGFAFIDVSRQRYDVVLMNPPFGASPPAASEYIHATYPQSYYDAYAAFMARTSALRTDSGKLGCLTSKTFFATSRLLEFRRWLLRDAGLQFCADLGQGVLDGAAVETAASVFTASNTETSIEFLDMRSFTDRGTALLESGAEGTSSGHRHRVSRSLVLEFPNSTFSVYWGSPSLLSVFSRFPGLDPAFADTAAGQMTGDDFRFLRARWETGCSQRHDWRTFAKGGAFIRYYCDWPLVVDWSEQALIEYRKQTVRSVLLSRRSPQFASRIGLAWNRVNEIGFNVRILPAGSKFSDKAPAVFPHEEPLALLGVLCSRLADRLCTLQNPNRMFEVRDVSALPVPTVAPARLKRLTSQMVEIKRQWTASSEPSAVFVSCFSVPPEMLPLSNWVEAIRTSADNDLRTLSGTQAEIDEIVETASELSAADLALLDDVLGAAPAEALTEELDQSCVELPARFWVNQVISYAFGCTVGHWDVGLAVNADLPAILGDPLGPLPVRAPGILTGADGLPLAAPPPNYPIAFPTDGILVDDPGHDRDLLTRIRQVFTILFSDDGEARLAEAVSILDPRADDLRPWLRRTFFEEHIQRYSKSRRKAPIYWRLGTPSGSYSVWIYLHRFTKDTLHRVMNDHVAPKLRYEQNRLDALSTDAGPSPTPSQRREIDALATLLEELQSLRDEVARLTPLWDPDLDDGVIINAAPLHRLFAHTRSWQKECETTWKKLCAGDYDWAHLSMRLWPERVVPKCCDDRSLAIAHGLEDTLWLESQGGKWHPKPIPDTEVAELVRQRTSAAVKDALRQLGESPAPIAARRTPTPRPERAPPAPRPPKPPRAQRVEQPTLDLEGRAPPAEALGALRIALRDFPDGAGKSELLAASGIDEALWTPSVNALLAAGEVQRFGEKRGTKYRWTGGES